MLFSNLRISSPLSVQFKGQWQRYVTYPCSFFMIHAHSHTQNSQLTYLLTHPLTHSLTPTHHTHPLNTFNPSRQARWRQDPHHHQPHHQAYVCRREEAAAAAAAASSASPHYHRALRADWRRHGLALCSVGHFEQEERCRGMGLELIQKLWRYVCCCCCCCVLLLCVVVVVVFVVVVMFDWRRHSLAHCSAGHFEQEERCGKGWN